MKRGTASPAQLVIRRYGVRGVIDWRPDLEAELRRANDLWNLFVEHFRAANERYRTTVDAEAGPEGQALDARIEALAAQKEEMRRRRAAARRESGRRVADREAAAEQRQIKQELSAARAERRALRKQVAAALKTALAEIEEWRVKADDDARRAAGVYWGTANALQNRFDAARKVLLDRRGRGMSAELRFRPFRGEGLFHNQIQGGASIEAFAERYLSGAGRSGQARLVAYTESERPPVTVTRERKGRIEVYQTRGPGEPQHVSVAVTLHRPIAPADSRPDEQVRIKDVELVLRRAPRETALTKHRWSASHSRLIVSGERSLGPPATCGDEVVAVNFGWRVADDRLRVATLVSDAGREPEHLLLPAPMLNNFTRVEELQRSIDLGVNAALLEVRRVPFASAPNEEIRGEGLRLAMAPTVGHLRLARMIARWRVEHMEWQSDALAALDVWRREDNKLSSQQDAARRESLGARQDLYRVWAKQLCVRARVVLIDAVDWTAAKRRKSDPADDLPQAVRRNRQIAAIGELTAALRNRARHTGTAIIEQPGPSTWTWCHVGDHPLDVPAELRADLRYFCGPCRTWLDQDVNNAAVRLARYLASVPAAAPGRGALAAE